jgi:hypothetical protein
VLAVLLLNPDPKGKGKQQATDKTPAKYTKHKVPVAAEPVEVKK